MSRMNKNSKTKLKLKNSTRLFFTVLFIIIFAFSTSAAYKAIFKSDVAQVSQSIYTYKNNYNLGYSVNMKKNNFITDEILPSGRTYVSDLVDSLDMHINYNYDPSEASDVTYNYSIDVILDSFYNDNGQQRSVWTKTDNVKKVENTQVSDGKFSIADDFKLDYSTYNTEVKNFKQSLGMLVDSFLKVQLTVNTTANVNGKKVSNKYVSDFSITVGDKVAVVSGKDNDATLDAVRSEHTINNTNINIFKVLVNVAFALLSAYVIYYIKFNTKKLNTIKNEYRLELNRILKACQDRIVMVKNKFEESSDETIVDVNDFGELLKLSEELYKPILCWTSDDLNNEQAWFSVISNKIRYRYILKK